VRVWGQRRTARAQLGRWQRGRAEAPRCVRYECSGDGGPAPHAASGRGASPPARGAISALSALGGSHRGSREPSGDGGGRWLRRAGGRTPTPPAPALRLPEAEGERGPAWATAAPEPEEEGEERLAAARAAAARGEPAGADSHGELLLRRDPFAGM